MLILKLGGAALTDKSTPNTARIDQIDQFAQLLAAYPQPLVLVHGAGSFGHILAEEYRLHEGSQGEEQRAALVQLQLQLHNLNTIIVKALVAAGIPAITLHPASMCVTKGRRIHKIFGDPLRHMIGMGIVPVLYGDCVWDVEQGFCILSGDQLVIHLANELKADRVAFGTNVAGVLDGKGRAVPHIHNLDTLIDVVGESEQPDVTGGMLGKLSEIGQIHSPGARVWIFELGDTEAFARILQGQADVGTLITKEES
jgi:isopentenyl phosphate kinase